MFVTFLKMTDKGHHEAEDEEGARGEDEDQDVGRRRQEGISKDGTAAQNFTDGTDNRQAEGKTQPHPDTVEHTIEHGVLGGKGLGAAQHDAVDHNQRDEQTQAFAQRRHKALYQQVNDGDEGGDDHDKGRNTHFVGDEVLEQGNQRIGHQQHERGGDTHAEPVEGGGGDTQRGAHTQNQYKGRVLFQYSVKEYFQLIHCQLLSPRLQFLPRHCSYLS